MADNQPGAKVSLAEIQSELPDAMGRKLFPGYDSHDFTKYVKLTPEKDNTCAFHLIVDFTGADFACSASDAGTLDAFLDAAKSLITVSVGAVPNPITVINATQTALHGIKKAIKAYDSDEDQKLMFRVYPCCHLGEQEYTVTLNVSGEWLITDKGDHDEIVNMNGILEASGHKSSFEFHANGTDSQGSTKPLGKTTSVTFSTATDFLVVITLHEDCHTDGTIKPWTDTVSAIKITDIQVVIDTAKTCEDDDDDEEDDGDDDDEQEDDGDGGGDETGGCGDDGVDQGDGESRDEGKALSPVRAVAQPPTVLGAPRARSFARPPKVAT